MSGYRELLVCKINHESVSAEQKMGLTKVRPDLFLMLINPIAAKLMVPNGTVIPYSAEAEINKINMHQYQKGNK